MRRLTFRGFMERYVMSLSYHKTIAIYPLAREAASDNPRLKEPLFLYAMSAGKVKTLMRAVGQSKLRDAYEPLLKNYNVLTLMTALADQSVELPEEYLKVWRSYQSEANGAERDARVKELMRRRILQIQRDKRVSTYRICQDLKINNSNVNSWLKHGASGKISIDHAREVLSYLESK